MLIHNKLQKYIFSIVSVKRESMRHVGFNKIKIVHTNLDIKYSTMSQVFDEQNSLISTMQWWIINKFTFGTFTLKIINVEKGTVLMSNMV